MAIFRVHKNKDYTTIDNNIFKNKELSSRAIGLLCVMLSLPDEWDYSELGLCQLRNERIDIIRGALKELEKQGYLKRQQEKNNGKFGKAVYDIYEKPIGEIPMSEKPITEKPITDLPISEKPTQLNTNILNTNILSTNILNTKLINNNNNTIYDYIEQNFGRMLTPIEYEVINQWQDNELTRYAIKQAVLNLKLSIKYIDKILSSYQKENITTVIQAQAREKEYQEKKEKQKAPRKTQREKDKEFIKKFYEECEREEKEK